MGKKQHTAGTLCMASGPMRSTTHLPRALHSPPTPLVRVAPTARESALASAFAARSGDGALRRVLISREVRFEINYRGTNLPASHFISVNLPLSLGGTRNASAPIFETTYRSMPTGKRKAVEAPAAAPAPAKKQKGGRPPAPKALGADSGGRCVRPARARGGHVGTDRCGNL